MTGDMWPVDTGPESKAVFCLPLSLLPLEISESGHRAPEQRRNPLTTSQRREYIKKKGCKSFDMKRHML